VAALIAIAAASVLPTVTVVDDSSAKRAAQTVALALRHARDESIRIQQPHQFALLNNTVTVRTTQYTTPGSSVPIVTGLSINPSSRQPYSLALTSNTAAGGLNTQAEFLTSDGQVRSTILFDDNGVPKHIDAAGHHLLNSGDILLSIDRRRYKVELLPNTGRVSVSLN